MSYFLGIEAGTTKVKAALVDDQKGWLAGASVDCAVVCAAQGRAEIDMEHYWRACRKCLALVAEKSGRDLKEVVALSVASQGVTFVPIDRRGKTLGKGIVLYDTRAGQETRDLIARFGEDQIFQITGQPKVSPLYQAPKLSWIRNHEPQRFRNIHKILLVHDYLVYKLTEKFAAVPSVLSSSLLLDLKKKKWWDRMLAYLDLSPDQLPDLYEHGQVVEKVSRKAARETGLSPQTLVVAGALDQTCGMAGMGNLAPGLISESTGTVLAVHTVADDFFTDTDSGILNFCHLRDGQYAWIGVCPTACGALDWFVENFAGEEKAISQKTKKNIFELLTQRVKKVPPGSAGLMMLPHLAGRGSPRPHPSARGLFYGFKLHHKKEHFVRALMESIAFAVRGNIEVFRRSGLTVREIRSFGGGSRNPLWNAIKANVCGLPVVTSSCPEPGCLGAALLAGVGVGTLKNLDDACRHLRSLNKPLYPDKTTVKNYENIYREYVELEEYMSPLFDRKSNF